MDKNTSLSTPSYQHQQQEHVPSGHKPSNNSTQRDGVFDPLFDLIYKPVLLGCILLLSAVVLFLCYTVFLGYDAAINVDEACKPACPSGSYVDTIQMPACTWNCVGYADIAKKVIPQVGAAIVVGIAAFMAYRYDMSTKL